MCEITHGPFHFLSVQPQSGLGSLQSIQKCDLNFRKGTVREQKNLFLPERTSTLPPNVARFLLKETRLMGLTLRETNSREDES